VTWEDESMILVEIDMDGVVQVAIGKERVRASRREAPAANLQT
jgi:hypothetical protein